jgi:hypothetical protein
MATESPNGGSYPIERNAGAPDVPTIAEAGLPGYEVTQWFGLFAPAAGAVIVAQLHLSAIGIDWPSTVRLQVISKIAFRSRYDPFMLRLLHSSAVYPERVEGLSTNGEVEG